MKPFRFSLESLLVLRRQKERASQQRYARSLIACEAARGHLQRATTELAAGWNSLGHELAQGIAASRLASLRTWCKVLETRWNERKDAVDEARHAADLAFQEMTSAMRGREALDRFYDKSRRAHDRAAQQEEQKTFDELATQLNGVAGPLQFAGQRN